MSDDAAYALTKTYWEMKVKMAKTSPWWAGVDQGLMGAIGGKIHPGAVRYYKEAGFALTDVQM